MSRRTRGEGSLFYEDSRARWVGVVDLGRGPDGKRKRRKVSGATRAEVARRLAEVRAQAATGQPVTNGNVTVADLLDRWGGDVLPAKVTGRTMESYRWAIEQHLAPGLGRRRLDKLSPDDVDAFLRAKAAEGYSRNSLIRFRSILGQALRWAEKRGMVSRNAATLSDLPADAREAKEGRALTPDEAHRLLDACQLHRLGALWVTQLSLGLRPGEVAALRWDDLDLDAAVPVVHVRSNLRWTGGRAELVAPKTARSRRSLALPARAVAALRRHREVHETERLVLGHHWPAEWAGLVFPSEAGTPLDPHNVRRELRKVAKAAGLGHLRPYDLRHSSATLMAASGVPLEHVADVLGHEGIRMARLVYVHAQAPHVDAGLAAMDRVLGDT